MSKFLQLADDIEADLRGLDNDADELNSRRLNVKERARTIFNDHNTVYDRTEEGLRRMEAVLHDMGGSNSRKATPLEKGEQIPLVGETPKLGEGSDATSDSSFPPKTLE